MMDGDILNMDIDELANDMDDKHREFRKNLKKVHDRPVAQNIGRSLNQQSGI